MNKTSILFTLAGAFAACGCHAPNLQTSSRDLGNYIAHADKGTDLSQARFIFDDFGTLNSHALETNAMPWKLYSVALLLGEEAKRGKPIAFNEESVYQVMQSYGFLRPKRIANWDKTRSPEPQLTGPVGLQRGMAKIRGLGVRVEISNINCSTCHSGMVYDAQGNPTNEAWLGASNSSLDLASYIATIYSGLKIGAKNPKMFLSKMRATWPMSRLEAFTMKRVIMRKFRKEMAHFEATSDHPTPFPLGGPGLTNGVGSFKLQLGISSKWKYDPNETGYTSVPDLGDRAFRSSLLCDGVYGVPGQDSLQFMTRKEATPAHLINDLSRIATYFTVGTAGGSFENADAVLPRIKQALTFISRYEPQRFPGKVDMTLAHQGAKTFASSCTRCHGTYSFDEAATRPTLESYPNYAVPVPAIGTDPDRFNLATQEMITVVEKDPYNSFNRNAKAEVKDGYVAPLLTGVWYSAPYLHNGSVPTLWHLMHPEARPEKFWVGGHRLDFEKVGIAGELDSKGVYRYATDYRPWSQPDVYDTHSESGRSNKGHERQFTRLSKTEKVQLLEFLKLL